MKKKQVFWDTFERNSLGHIEYDKSMSCMYREGDSIIYMYYDFDHEDNRRYDYVGNFKVEDYRKAIEELQKTGKSELTGPNYHLSMRKSDDSVELVFSGSLFATTTPGGASLSGSIRITHKIEDLLLRD